MGEFLVFMLILFGFIWGSALLLPRVQRSFRRVDETVDHEVLARLLEDMDQISTRLNRVEEELDFFKDLNAPEDPGRLPPGGNGEEG